VLKKLLGKKKPETSCTKAWVRGGEKILYSFVAPFWGAKSKKFNKQSPSLVELKLKNIGRAEHWERRLRKSRGDPSSPMRKRGKKAWGGSQQAN